MPVVESAVRVRQGSKPNARGNYARKEEGCGEAAAGIQAQFMEQDTQVRVRYTWRVEGAFSVINQRIFGEYVAARKFVNMAKEMAMKASIHLQRVHSCGVAGHPMPSGASLMTFIHAKSRAQGKLIPSLLLPNAGAFSLVRLYDLSQPLSQETPFWPYYPPFEVKFIKRKAEHGVNAQYIMTSNHIGTHLDAPLHFVTGGKTIDQIPLTQLYGPGVIVDVSEVGDLGLYTPKLIESKVEVKDGDILLLYTGFSKYAWYQKPKPQGTADEERYIHLHPGGGRDMVEWFLKRKIKLWGVDAVSTDHPMNLPIGRFLPRVCDKVRGLAERKFGGKEAVDKLFPLEDYQLTHNALFPHDCIHIENLGGEMDKLLNRRVTIGCFPWLFKGGEAAFARVVAFVEE